MLSACTVNRFKFKISFTLIAFAGLVLTYCKHILPVKLRNYNPKQANRAAGICVNFELKFSKNLKG